MNQELKELVKIYAIGEHSALHERLAGLSRDSLTAVFTDLLTGYINDKNSSTLREFVTTTISGYTHLPQKLGYNGYRQTGLGKPLYCEVKPQNFCTADLETHKRGERKTRPTRLGGGGNFNGYRHRRFERDLRETPQLLVSGFVDGRLIYVLEIPFAVLISRLKKRLKDKLPDGDKPGVYLIGAASFNFSDYADSPELKIKFLLPLRRLQEYRNYITRGFYHFLASHAKDR